MAFSFSVLPGRQSTLFILYSRNVLPTSNMSRPSRRSASQLLSPYVTAIILFGILQPLLCVTQSFDCPKNCSCVTDHEGTGQVLNCSEVATDAPIVQHSVKKENVEESTLLCSDGCVCQELGRTLNCSNYDTILSIPNIDRERAMNFTSIYIANQPRLKKVENGELQNFTNVVKITIKDSGLQQLGDNVFQNLVSFQKLHLQNNNISIFRKQYVDSLDMTEVFLQGNPLQCTCYNFWLLKSPNLSNLSHPFCNTDGLMWTEPDGFGSDNSMELPAGYFRLNYIASPCAAPMIRYIQFGGNSYMQNFKLIVVGWPLPSVRWAAQGGFFKGEKSPTIGEVNSKGEIIIRGTMQPAIIEGSNFSVVVENTLGRVESIYRVVPGKGYPHKYGKNVKTSHLDPPQKGLKENKTEIIQDDVELWADSEAKDISRKVMLYEIITPVVGFVILVILTVCVYLKFRGRINTFIRQHYKKKRRVLGTNNYANRVEDMPLTGIVAENPNYNNRFMNSKINCCSSSCVKKIPPENILPRRCIGEGAFGRVFLGECKDLERRRLYTSVAIKTLKGNSSDSFRRDFEREAEFLATLKHENIVLFHGACTEGEDWMMVFEYMEHGDLKNYLRCHQPDIALYTDGTRSAGETLTKPQLLLIIVQIAKGLRYLATQRFVHRDLATRNCLVGNGLKVKIGDFGMARDIYSTDYYVVKDNPMLPLRWHPPESIFYGTFTVESDVWSFGVTMWEVVTYGLQPWSEFTNPEVVEHIKNNRVLPRPSDCPDLIYSLMKGCWRVNPQERYDMKEICELLKDAEWKQPEYLALVG